MRSTVLAVSSVGLVQGVSEMPLPDILKSIVSIVVGVSYCLDLVLKLKAKRKARNYYKTKGTTKP